MEDPEIFVDSKDPNLYEARREWPDISIPKKVSSSAVPAAAFGSSKGVATDPVPGATAPNEDLIQQMLDVHHMQVRALLGIGVDPCKEYAKTQVSCVGKGAEGAYKVFHMLQAMSFHSETEGTY